MSSIDDLVAAIRAALELIRAAEDRVSSSHQDAEELREQFSRLGAEDKASRAESVKTEIETQQATLAAAAKRGETALTQAEALRGTDRRRGTHPLPTASSGSRDTRPPQFDPVPLLEALPRFERKRGTSPRTRGTLQTNDGVKLDFVSGVDSSTPRIRDHMWNHVGPVSNPRGFWSESHAELKAALAMSDRRITEADMVINNSSGPCAGDLGCDSLLPRYLQPGARLTVHWPDEEGVTRSRTYVGTLR